MKAWAKILIIILILALGATLFVLVRRGDVPTPPTDNTSSTPTPTPPINSTSTSEKIRVTSPQPNAVVTSPLTITGEARGNWYFEASFPVEILDANGKRLGIVPAEALGEWMTVNFVPFRAILTFATSSTPTGTLVLHKDNPSDMREFDDELRIPVRFAPAP